MVSNYQRMLNAIKLERAKLGINFVESKVPAKDKDGNIIKDASGKPVMHTVSTYVGMTDEAKELFETLNENVPCWFKGCEKLREQFKTELDNSSCKQCKGTIMRKYMQLARHMLDDDPDRVRPNMPTAGYISTINNLHS